MIFLLSLALNLPAQTDPYPPAATYPHLPSVACCRRNLTIAEAGVKATMDQATFLGYYGWDQAGEKPFGWRQIWVGGGIDGERLREEFAERSLRVRVWRVALTLQEGTDEEGAAEDSQRELRGLIGDKAFVCGTIPPPIR